MSPKPPSFNLTACWRESFAIHWLDLPDRVKLPAPGKITPKGMILNYALRFAALAQADGWLSGPQGAYVERQMAIALGAARTTARGVLRWFEAEGWLVVERTTSRREADVRRLVIPADATVAPPGWPLVQVVGYRSRSTSVPQAVSVTGAVVGHSSPVVGHSSPVVGHSPRSNGIPPPGVPVLPEYLKEVTGPARAEVTADEGISLSPATETAHPRSQKQSSSATVRGVSPPPVIGEQVFSERWGQGTVVSVEVAQTATGTFLEAVVALDEGGVQIIPVEFLKHLAVA